MTSQLATLTECTSALPRWLVLMRGQTAPNRPAPSHMAGIWGQLFISIATTLPFLMPWAFRTAVTRKLKSSTLGTHENTLVFTSF